MALCVRQTSHWSVHRLRLVMSWHRVAPAHRRRRSLYSPCWQRRCIIWPVWGSSSTRDSPSSHITSHGRRVLPAFIAPGLTNPRQHTINDRLSATHDVWFHIASRWTFCVAGHWTHLPQRPWVTPLVLTEWQTVNVVLLWPCHVIPQSVLLSYYHSSMTQDRLCRAVCLSVFVGRFWWTFQVWQTLTPVAGQRISVTCVIYIWCEVSKICTITCVENDVIVWRQDPRTGAVTLLCSSS